MDDFPSALILTSREELFSNNNVLYRLVEPLLDGSGVRSSLDDSERLVNVVPFRRIYSFDHKTELYEFSDMLLRRPLVLQPVLHFGRGLGHCCGACYTNEPWIVLVNQTHPKILSRLQIGLETAKSNIAKGLPFEIKFCFTKLIQRIYRHHLKNKELAEAKGNKILKMLTHFRFAEWEHGNLVLRHLGGKTHETRHMPTTELIFDFEDISEQECFWSLSGNTIFQKSHMAAVTKDEIRHMLPTWTVNEVSPLEGIGESAPLHAYSYSQAGRLYESFRKKKKQKHEEIGRCRNNSYAGATAMSEEIRSRDEPYGCATAMREEIRSIDDSYGGATAMREEIRSRDDCYAGATAMPQEIEVDLTKYNPQRSVRPRYREQPRDFDYIEPDLVHGDHQFSYNIMPSNRNDRQYLSTQPDTYGHFEANVKIINNPSSSHSHDMKGSMIPPFVPLKKHGSNCSSNSTNADSGYSAESDIISYNRTNLPEELRKPGRGYDNAAFQYNEKDIPDYTVEQRYGNNSKLQGIHHMDKNHSNQDRVVESFI